MSDIILRDKTDPTKIVASIPQDTMIYNNGYQLCGNGLSLYLESIIVQNPITEKEKIIADWIKNEEIQQAEREKRYLEYTTLFDIIVDYCKLYKAIPIRLSNLTEFSLLNRYNGYQLKLDHNMLFICPKNKSYLVNRDMFSRCDFHLLNMMKELKLYCDTAVKTLYHGKKW